MLLGTINDQKVRLSVISEQESKVQISRNFGDSEPLTPAQKSRSDALSDH
jgi:hypothetical protein